MPPGLRPSLYVKDDDYMQSFLNGNFITLTNINKEDISEIIKHRIGPLNISMHSMDPVIRERIFGNRGHSRGLKHLKHLDKAGVKTNIQIVLLPGINDGKDLENTIEALCLKYENIESVGIVPVGITKFNSNSELSAVDKKSAEEVLSLVDKMKGLHGEKVSDKVYLSDEFYLIAGRKIPPFKSYGKFLQINNGIGKSADFLNDIGIFFKKRPLPDKSKKEVTRVLLVTSEYGKKILKQGIGLLEGYLSESGTPLSGKITIDMLEVKNSFFGGNVKVTGLLTGEDIIKSLNQADTGTYCSILIPDPIFNNDGLTLDGYEKDSISSAAKNVKIVPEEGKDLVNEIFKSVDG